MSICHAIIDHLIDGIVVVDVTGHIVTANPAARRFITLPDTELAGRQAQEIFAAVPGLTDVIQNPGQNEAEVKIRHKNGNWHITVTVRALLDEQNKSNGHVIIFRDTSDQKRAESELHQLTETHNAALSSTSEQLMQEMAERDLLEQQLRQSRKMEVIGRLAGGISHDFNNLLTAILGSAELGLQESISNYKLRQRFLDIRNGALIARDLTGRLQGFSHPEKPQRKCISLNHVIGDLLNMIDPILGEDIKLNIQLAPTLYPSLVDSDQMRQLIVNLCANARDHLPEGGELTIKTDNLDDLSKQNSNTEIDQESSYIVLTFVYTGDGVPEDIEQDLFNSPCLETNTENATNLGWTIIQGIIEQHQGQVTVNTVGKGTSVKVYLPAIPDMELIVNSDDSNNNMTGGTETILLVEDNDMVLNVATRLLNELGYKVLVAHNADEAMDLFGKNSGRIDLVMSDVVMPRSSGPEMFSRMRAMQPALPALFVTGYDVNQGIEALEMLECRDNCEVLQKPYSQEILAGKIREMINRNRS